MLIAAEKGARLIVSVGSQFNLVEFLDRNRKGMSSTFLTRLRIGEILVDAKGVSRLYRPRPGPDPAAGRDRRGPDRDDRRRLDDPRPARRGGPALAEAPAAGRWSPDRSSPEADRPGAGSFDVRLPLPRALPRRRPARPGRGRRHRRGDRRLQPRLLGQERHRPRPQLGSQRRPAPGGPAARPAGRRGSLRERPLPDRRPRPAERAQRRPGVPRRLLQPGERPRARRGHAGRRKPRDGRGRARAARSRGPRTRGGRDPLCDARSGPIGGNGQGPARGTVRPARRQAAGQRRSARRPSALEPCPQPAAERLRRAARKAAGASS